MSSRKGKKAIKNVPIFHEELKAKHTVWLTPQAWERLQSKAISSGISVSELLEKIATELNLDCS
ncbi:CopG domain protein DNA-binding domain protein [Kalymmatonema gypsitolerans NIES-4073]|nr:CopG domain protein DNA-binding domain protein [Scytonema sp. HK-05]BAY49963.1 CopG domain protein DNA-binding domain protein [Scytonema sp. HK-05]BAZ21801.1 CopG domain protein DNA-binding domain protein [Scytonema sp. NIES-4073]